MGAYDLDMNSYVKIKDPVFSSVNEAFNNMNDLMSDLTTNNGDGSEISEIDMMRLNVMVSKFNTMINLASGIFKNLCDGEKTIAQKM